MFDDEEVYSVPNEANAPRAAPTNKASSASNLEAAVIIGLFLFLRLIVNKEIFLFSAALFLLLTCTRACRVRSICSIRLGSSDGGGSAYHRRDTQLQPLLLFEL